MLKITKIMPWFVWFIAAVFYFYEFFLQISLSVVSVSLVKEFMLSASALGLLASLYYYTYSLMQIPVGIFLDKFGARTPSAIAILMCVFGTSLFVNAGSFFMLALGRFCMGIGAAFALIGCLYIAATKLPKKVFPLVSGLTFSIGMCGAIVAQAPLALLVQDLGWRNALLPLIFLGIALAVLVYFLFPNTKNNSAVLRHENDIHDVIASIKKIAGVLQNWIISLQIMFMAAPAIVLGVVWGFVFINVKYGFTVVAVASVVSMIFFGWMIGAFVIGWLATVFKRRKLLLFIVDSVALLDLFFIIYSPKTVSFIQLSVLFFILGFCISGVTLAFAIVKEANSEDIVGSAMGFMNSVSMLGGGILPWLVGVVLYHVRLSHRYTANDFKIALLLLPLFSLLSLVLLFFIKEPRSEQ